MLTLSIWNSTREGAWIMEPGQWGMKWNFTRNLPELHTRYIKEDSSSFEAKGSHTEYQIVKLGMLKKMSQWLIILFGLLLNQFWFKLCDSGLVRKPRCYSFLHKQFMLPDYVRRSHQYDLSKQANIGTFFWATVYMWGLGCSRVILIPLYQTVCSVPWKLTII